MTDLFLAASLNKEYVFCRHVPGNATDVQKITLSTWNNPGVSGVIGAFGGIRSHSLLRVMQKDAVLMLD